MLKSYYKDKFSLDFITVAAFLLAMAPFLTFVKFFTRMYDHTGQMMLYAVFLFFWFSNFPKSKGIKSNFIMCAASLFATLITKDHVGHRDLRMLSTILPWAVGVFFAFRALDKERFTRVVPIYGLVVFAICFLIARILAVVTKVPMDGILPEHDWLVIIYRSYLGLLHLFGLVNTFFVSFICIGFLKLPATEFGKSPGKPYLFVSALLMSIPLFVPFVHFYLKYR